MIIDTNDGPYEVLDKNLFFAFISKQVITTEIIKDLAIKNILKKYEIYQRNRSPYLYHYNNFVDNVFNDSVYSTL